MPTSTVPRPIHVRLHRCATVLTAVAALTVTTGDVFAQWTATILHPPQWVNSFAIGVSGIEGVPRVVGYGQGSLQWTHACMWRDTAASWVDMNPPGYNSSMALGVEGNRQVGWGRATNGQERALRWSGSAGNSTPLLPLLGAGKSSLAFDIAGNQQVGRINAQFATVWNGPASHTVLGRGTARRTDGTRQVGCLRVDDGGGELYEACMWSGTPESIVTLHPAGAFSSIALGISAGTQAGWCRFSENTQPHAVLWYGSADSYIDLHPAGFVRSEALASSGLMQAGRIWLEDGTQHASFWIGTPESCVDLHELLPGTYSSSIVYGMWTDGSVVHVVGSAGDILEGGGHAVLWTYRPPVPCNGDVNCDMALDGFDVESQERAIGGNTADYCQLNPDFNHDSALDGLDIEAVERVVGGGDCP